MVTIREDTARPTPPSVDIHGPFVVFLGPCAAPDPTSVENAKVSLAQLNISCDVSMQVQMKDDEDKDKATPSTDEGGSNDE